MPSPADIALLDQWQGQIVPRSVDPGFVVLSGFISFIGAWTTLELINRRTAGRGSYNWFLLIGSSVSMGGVAIWCMHYIGNHAVILGSGQSFLQISYNPGFTALSFFVPIIVLQAAFMAVGSDEQVSITRIGTGGFLAGLAICGMHYLGQAGISNYTPIYQISYVIGSAIVAVMASVTALTVFFALRASWTTSWWKRAIVSIILSGAVSGMHWVATVGTEYRLKNGDSALGKSTRKQTVIVVIFLSISSCMILLAFSLVAQNRKQELANRAQQVALACAIFDRDGKLMVTPEGTLPSQKITDAFVEKTSEVEFGIYHHEFLWIFRTSRSWDCVSSMIPAMRRHLHSRAKPSHPGTKSEINLTDDQGDRIDGYSTVFRELFCLAAAALADQLSEPLENVGVLYDEIIATGSKPKFLSKYYRRSRTEDSLDIERDSTNPSMFGRGKLLFLTRQANRQDADNLQAAGFRFANVGNVVSILAQSMQVDADDLSRRLIVMREYSRESHMLDSGVYIACFAIRALITRNDSDGFEVLVRRGARNQLPTIKLPMAKLDAWHTKYLLELDELSIAQCMKWLRAKSSNPIASKAETKFASQLLDALEDLHKEVNDPFFFEAMCIARPVDAPCKGLRPNSRPGTAQIIAFRLMASIHARTPGPKLEFIPFSFVRIQQLIYKNSPDHGVWARQVHRDFGSILNSGCPPENSKRNSNKFLRRPSASRGRSWAKKVLQHNDDIPLGSLRRASRGTLNSSSEKENPNVEQPSFGGIMVSQEVSVDIHDRDGKPRLVTGGESSDVELTPISPVNTDSSMAQLVRSSLGALEPHRHGNEICMGTSSGVTNEVQERDTFVDLLFRACVTGR